MLHRDAVSGGGYFMIGTVISSDLDLIGQLQPHASARFVPGHDGSGVGGKARPSQGVCMGAIRESL